MGSFSITVQPSNFAVTKNINETDNASIFEYVIDTSDGESIDFSLIGDYENAVYKSNGVEFNYTTPIVGLIYNTSLVIEFSIPNSGVPGLFLEADLTVTNQTLPDTYTDTAVRENDNAPSDQIGTSRTSQLLNDGEDTTSPYITQQQATDQFMEDVSAGNGVSIDKTDPANYIISSTTTLEEARANSNILEGNVDFNDNNIENLKGLGFKDGEQITWNDTYNTINVPTGFGTVIKVGTDTVFQVWNNTGATLGRGTVVYPTGTSTNGFSNVDKAIADSHETLQFQLGVISWDIPDGQMGHVMTTGILSDIDTSNAGVTGPMYLSSTIPGFYTATPPEFPYYKVLVGIVDKLGTTDGVFSVDTMFNLENTTVNFWNGTIRESFIFEVTSDGTAITGSLYPKNGHPNLTMVFSDGFHTIQTTPPATINLTPGTFSLPQLGYIYIPKTTKVLTASATGFPNEEHIKIATVLLQSVLDTQADGPLHNQNFNDHIQGTIDNQGHLTHITERLRAEGAKWLSGIELTATAAGNSSTVSTTGGQAYQLHKQTLPAYDMAAGDHIHIFNHDVTPYERVTDLNELVNDAVGNSLNNSSFSIVFWGSINSGNNESKLFANLPVGVYSRNNPDLAVSDASSYSVFSIPTEFRGTGFLIARVTYVRQSNGDWSVYETEDLRGLSVGASGSGSVGGSGVTTFAALTDTPNSYIGEGNKMLVVGSGEAGLEFVDNTALRTIYDNTNSGFTAVDVQAAIDELNSKQAGGLESGKYKFLTNTTASDPGAGNLKFNSLDYSLVTELYVDTLSDEGTDITFFLDAANAGDRLLVQDQGDVGSFASFEFSGSPVNNSGWWTIPVTNIDNNGAISNNSKLSVSLRYFNLEGGNADTLDGLNSTQFLRSDVDAVSTANLTANRLFLNNSAIANNEAVRLDQLNSALQGTAWRDPVIDITDFTISVPSTPSDGDRYVNTGQDGTYNANSIYEWDSSQWVEFVPLEGWTVWVYDVDTTYKFNGVGWVDSGSTISHNNTIGLQGGALNEYYHLTADQYNNVVYKNQSNTISATSTVPLTLISTSSVNSRLSFGNTTSTGGLYIGATGDAINLWTAGIKRYEISQTGNHNFQSGDIVTTGDIKANKGTFEGTEGRLFLNGAGAFAIQSAASGNLNIEKIGGDGDVSLTNKNAGRILKFKTEDIERYTISSAGNHDFKSGDITTLGTVNIGASLKLWETASTGYIDNIVGHSFIRQKSDGKSIYFELDDTSGASKSALSLVGGSTPYLSAFFDGVEKLRTTSYGILANGEVRADDFTIGGASINTAGTLSNVAYLDVENTFTELQTLPNLDITNLQYNNESISVLVQDEILGEELVTNGGFDTDTDWTKGTGWTISGGVATHSGAAGYISQSSVTIGKTYDVTIDITQVNGGYLSLISAFWIGGIAYPTSVGTHTQRVEANNEIMYFYANGDISIDNVSVREVISSTNAIQKRVLGSAAFEDSGNIAYLDKANTFTKTNTFYSTLGATDMVGYGIEFSRSNANYITAKHASGFLLFQTGGNNNRMAITSNGYVGIGTTAPTEKLDVVGNVKATSFIGDGSQLTNLPLDDYYTSSEIELSQKNISWGESYVQNFRSLVLDDGGTWFPNSLGYEIGRQHQVGSRPSLQIHPVASKAYKTYVVGKDRSKDGSFVRNCTKTYVDEDGIIQTAAANELPVDYSDGEGVLLLEPQATNLITYSEDFSQGYWNKSNVNITANSGISPEGNNNATLISSNGLSAFPRLETNVSLSGHFVYSVFVKKSTSDNVYMYVSGSGIGVDLSGSTTYQFNFNTQQITKITGGSISKTDVKDFGNGWYRITMEDTATSITSYRIYTDWNVATTNSSLVWGAELKENDTSYIPTNGSTVTRLQDEATNFGTVDDFNSEEGVLVLKCGTDFKNGKHKRINISDGTSGNLVEFRYNSNDLSTVASISSGGVSQAVLSFGDDFSEKEYVILWKYNRFEFYVNGIKVNEDLTINTPIGLNTLFFAYSDGSTGWFHGKTKYVKVHKSIAEAKKEYSYIQ